MSTPTPTGTPTLSLATDQTSYVSGQAIQVTATYADAESNPVQLTINASAEDAQGNSASATTQVTVVEQASEQMTVTITDSFGDTYAEQSNTLSNGTGTSIQTSTVTAPASS